MFEYLLQKYMILSFIEKCFLGLGFSEERTRDILTQFEIEQTEKVLNDIEEILDEEEERNLEAGEFNDFI